MAEHSKPKVKDWDLTLPDSIALSVFVKSIVDAAIMAFKAHTPNRAGLAHEVLPPAEHQQMFGFAAAPIPEPGDFFGTAAQMKNQQKIADLYAMQERLIAMFWSITVDGLPLRILRLAEVDGSLRHHLHVHNLLADLKAKIHLTSQDLALCKEAVRKPFTRGAPIRAFVADQLRFLGYLAEGGQGLANHDAVELLKSAFLSTRADKADFAPALAEYLVAHGSMAGRTPATWCEFIIVYVEDRLDHHSEANMAARRGIANSAVEDEQATLESMSGPLADEFKAFLVQKNKPKEPPRRSKRKAAAISGVLPSGPAQPGDPLYCWTHGAVGHASSECNHPDKKHIAAASFRNQMKGTPAYV
jgi:hypothetical protein